jgi:acetyl-CoA acetyltransferase
MSRARGSAHAAITGCACSVFGRESTRSARELAADAVVAAVADAGLARSDVGGLVLARSPLQTAVDLPLRLQADLSLTDLGLACAVDASGASFVQAVQLAALAIGAGQVEHVVCVFADAPLAAAVSAQQAFSRAMPLSGVPGWEAEVGLFGAPGAFALLAQSWLERHGAGAEALFAHVEATRRWAAGNPLARQKASLSFDDYLASPWVVEPLRIADCAFPVNGAVAIVVSRAGRSDGTQPPVYIHALAQAHAGRTTLTGDDAERPSGAAVAAARLYAAAGIAPRDVRMLQAYDAFSVLGLMALADYGLVPEAEVAAFVRAGHTAPGGTLPVNTGGGHLAGFYLQGATPVHEAVVQLRGQGGARQVDLDGPVLVTGVGGRYEHHAALLLGARERL